jgi:hexosaminidase
MQVKKLSFIDSYDNSTAKSLKIEVNAESDNMNFDYDTYEGYQLKVLEKENEIHAIITAKNFYGIRHGLETLSQLIVYDDHNNAIVMLTDVEIEDEPKFKHRGISMDTSRTFIPVEIIKRTINGLAMVKMNTFHWHITDSQSMPLELKSHSEMTRLGAYSPDKIYKISDVQEIVKFALARGVRVIPEFDTPAHVGEGWQHTGVTLCYKEPGTRAQWRGHFDPTKDELYDILEDIYREIVKNFNPIVFHMGGDEVSIACWNSSASIKNWMASRDIPINESGFMQLWSHFQEKAIERLDKVMNAKVPIVVWTSSLTEDPYLSQLLDKDRYIVQIWLSGDDKKITTLLEKGYNLIMSNSDVLYLDCGIGGWVNEGLNWCAPYKTWQQIYENKMETIAGEFIDQIYGAETAIWNESTDENAIENRIWPRTSALAERLWSSELRFESKIFLILIINILRSFDAMAKG